MPLRKDGFEIWRVHLKRLQMKALRRMRVVQYGMAYVTVADQRCDACERHIQTSRFRKLWRKQTELYLAGAPRFCMKHYRQNRGLWRMGFKVEVQQPQPELFIIRRL